MSVLLRNTVLKATYKFFTALIGDPEQTLMTSYDALCPRSDRSGLGRIS